MAHTYLIGGCRPSDGRGVGGGRSSKTFDKGGGQGAVSKNVFSALWASVCSKDKGVVVVVVVVVGGGGLPWIRLCI